MNYIKDTDFLPRVKDVSNDVYKLLYGVAKLRVETKIYDTITVMCRRYPDTPLLARCRRDQLRQQEVVDDDRAWHRSRPQAAATAHQTCPAPSNILIF